MILWILGGAVVSYLAFSKNQALFGPTVPGSKPTNYQPSQPSQTYPWRAITPPRVDNANQPWYNGSQLPMSSNNTGSGIQQAAGALQAGSSIIHSLSDIWGSLSPVPTDDADSNLVASADDMPTPEASSLDENLMFEGGVDAQEEYTL